ncbi:fatty acid synthase-like [Photinus pyralis]|nr:fatty acid synthase-like [Photinus pyralis]
MAAVGLSLEECQKRCPPGIGIGCHNSKDNVTITGPENLVDDFVAKLTADGIFSRTVPSAGLAFHSNYIANAVPALQKAFDEIIPHPKPRSSKWISSSFPESAWDTLGGKLCSAEYHITNVIAPVLFYEAIQHIPKNAIVIEIAPHGLLQAILKRTLHSECTNISLVSRAASNNVDFFLSAIGKIFNAGAQPQIARMYPPVQYPVGRGTTMINSLVEWDHSEKWTVVNFAEQSSMSGECKYNVDLTKELDQFLTGHKLHGKIVFPVAGYLIMAWKTLAKLRNEDFEQMPVVMEEVQFKRGTKISMDAVVKFSINILESSGEFEICEGGSSVVSGKIFVPRDVSKEFVPVPQAPIKAETDLLQLTTDDIYKELRFRGYDYEGPFRLIESSDNRFVNGIVKRQSNWVTDLDALFQFTSLGQKARDLYVPTRIRRVVINPTLHRASNNSVPISMFPKTGVAHCGGFQVHQIKWSISRKPLDLVPPKLERYKFVPYDDVILPREHALTVLTQIVLENTDALKLRVIEMLQDTNKVKTFHIKEAIEAEPKLSVDYAVIKLIETNLAEFETEQVQVLPREMLDQFKANVHLVVMKDVQSPGNLGLTKSACAALKPGGFILSEEQELSDIVILQSLGLKAVATHCADMTNFVLLRKPLEIQRDLLVLKITEKNYKWVTPLAQALKKSATDGTKIFLVSQGDEFSGLVGLVNCLKKEPGGMNVRAYYIPKETKETFSLSSAYYQNQIEKDLIHNVLKYEMWGSYRHLLLDRNIVASNHAYINIDTKGDLTTLRWVEGPHHSPEDTSDLCSVYYASVNFRDVMLATGHLPSDAVPGEYGTHECLMGLEFSGRDSKGRRVMGLVESRGLALTCIAQPHLLWEVPKQWTLEEAATVPLVYGTAYYALIIRGQLQPGDSILIHSGAGGVGQAAISVALSMGCTVFTTVGNQSKRTFLKQTFPQLRDEHIGNSRDASFEQLILNETDGRGVDVVLNSLAGDLLQASVRCLAWGGRFLEIGKVDLFDNSLLGMSVFLKNTTFHGILFDVMIEKNNYHTPRIVQLVSDGIASGVVRPLSSTVFGEDQAEEAFRFMASGKHIGKILLKIRTEEDQSVCIPRPTVTNCVAHNYMHPKKSYVVVGGLGGFGLELTTWLILRGATKIVLCCHNGVTTGYQSLCIRRWREDGATIAISQTDVTSEHGVSELFKEALHHGPIGGVFNLAEVLEDAQTINLSAEDFEAVCQPKIQGTKNLDAATRSLAPNLDHFVVFSSISCGRGGMGQANNGFANSAMERICESRQADGFPGLAIQWGTVDDVGIAKKVDEVSLALGIIPQRIRSCLNTMDVFINQPHAIVASMVLGKSVKVEKEIGMADVVANILGLKDFKTVSPTMVFSDFGMDSLMVSEIKQTLEENYDIHLTVDGVRSLTFERLSLLSIAK